MTAPLELRLPPTAEAVGELMDRLEAWAEAAALPQRLASHLMLACEELAANIAAHGAGADFMAFSVCDKGGALRVVVVDDGPAFDPLTIAAPDTDAEMDARDPGGLGLHLVRRLSSALSYARSAGCNRTSLVLDGPG